MAHEYQLLPSPTTVLRNLDGAFVPFDPANRDYQQYLDYLAGGGVPDPVPTPTAAMTALLQLEANDALMFRALEVLIDVLLAKNVILATDFSVAVRNMYQARKALRVTAGVP
jgi:hypothetical protein